MIIIIIIFAFFFSLSSFLQLLLQDKILCLLSTDGTNLATPLLEGLGSGEELFFGRDVAGQSEEIDVRRNEGHRGGDAGMPHLFTEIIVFLVELFSCHVQFIRQPLEALEICGDEVSRSPLHTLHLSVALTGVVDLDPVSGYTRERHFEWRFAEAEAVEHDDLGHGAADELGVVGAASDWVFSDEEGEEVGVVCLEFEEALGEVVDLVVGEVEEDDARREEMRLLGLGLGLLLLLTISIIIII